MYRGGLKSYSMYRGLSLSPLLSLLSIQKQTQSPQWGCYQLQKLSAISQPIRLSYYIRNRIITLISCCSFGYAIGLIKVIGLLWLVGEMETYKFMCVCTYKG